MLIIKNHGFKRRYKYGGSGIFEPIAEPSLSSIIGAGGSNAIAIQDLVRKLNGSP